MQYKDVRDGKLFEQHGRVYRKASNAYAIDVMTGKQSIPALHDRVHPITPGEAAEKTGMDKRYLE